MSRNIWVACVIFLIATIVVGDFADARRRRRRRSNYSNNYSTGSKRVPSRVDSDSARFRSLGVFYDYDRAMADTTTNPDRLPVFLDVNDTNVLGEENLVAEVKLTDLADQTTNVRYVPVSLDRDSDLKFKPGSFELLNEKGKDPIIRPARVYQVFVNLHRKSEKYDGDSALGRLSMPYYVATDGPTRICHARRKIVMRTFKEYYYRKIGWRSGERYSIDCYAYYMWATGFCTVGSSNGHTRLGSLFGRRAPWHNGGQISALASRNPIHGDYVRMPGHSLMLLAYDADKRQVWTMEGNFNHTIEIVVRPVNSGWTVGHLVDQHIRDDVFAPDPATLAGDMSGMGEVPGDTAGDMTNTSETSETTAESADTGE